MSAPWSDLVDEDHCICGEPAEADCHKIGTCFCRRDSHVFGCHYLPWAEVPELMKALEDSVIARDASNSGSSGEQETPQ